MNCDPELLQAYLDDELEEGPKRELREHLAACRPCRRELAQLRLLWLELAQEEKVSLPPEWPYLRQQVIAAARADHVPPQENIGFWEGQRLAWQNVGLATAYLPGTAGAVNMAKAAGREMPGLFLGLLGTAGRLWRNQTRRGREGGPSR